MFYYIEGEVTVLGQNIAVLDVSGVGYLLNVSLNTLSYLEKGKRARLYTLNVIREDAFDIYGFYDEGEKRCFEMLLGVSGVGPKAALSILSSTTPEGLTMAIMSGNEKALTAAPGIGKRIAQRIILELKDKMAKESMELPGSVPGAFIPSGSASEKKMADTVAALTVLGYSQAEIAAALNGVDVQSMTVEELVRHVLRGSVK